MEFTLTANLVDVFNRAIYPAAVSVANGRIKQISRLERPIGESAGYIMPGFVDAHIHVESSMLLPSAFARVAVTHGTVATVSDPHEIANVCGVPGVELMLRNAAKTKFKFLFGAPSCVPATRFETAGATVDVAAVTKLLDDPRIGYLSEMMDFPGVLNRNDDVMAKIQAAIDRSKPIDGHAPGLMGADAAKYISSGITTDHECFTLEEALDKIAAGCKIAIREGSAARNFEALHSLISSHPLACMLCSDDKHPDEFLLGHINALAARAIQLGHDLMDIVQVACVNPVEHYGMNVGLLREGDAADFIIVKDVDTFEVMQTYIDGELMADDGRCLMPKVAPESINQFVANPISAPQLEVPATGKNIRVIGAIGGQLITKQEVHACRVVEDMAVADVERDLLKIVVVNRYHAAPPAVAFATGFGLKQGAFASSVAHDSHNVIAVGTNDDDLVEAINAVISENGGLSVSADGQTDVLPLPVAGLMSTQSCRAVGEHYGRLDGRLKKLGSNLRAPYMTLSFMALLVIPSLKLSDQGLFDGETFEFVPLFVD